MDGPKKSQGRRKVSSSGAVALPRENKANHARRHLAHVTQNGKKIYDRLVRMIEVDDIDNMPKDSDVLKACDILLDRLFGPVPSATLSVQSVHNPNSNNNSPFPDAINVVSKAINNSELVEATAYLKAHLTQLRAAEDKRVSAITTPRYHPDLKDEVVEGVITKEARKDSDGTEHSPVITVFKDEDAAERMRLLDEAGYVAGSPPIPNKDK